MTGLTAAVVAVVLLIAAPRATVESPAAPSRASSHPKAVPWGVGEKLVYDVKFGALHVGTGGMEVKGIDTLRGRETWHTQFRVKGGTFFYRVNDLMESWFETETLSSLRYVQDFQEGGRDRERTFDIFPDRRVYSEDGKEENPSVESPLDDGSFLYFIRTVPLEVGQSYEFNRYFRPDRNPVTIRVLRREQVRVPAGTFDAIVIQPVIKAKGIFSEGGRAEVWLADDSTRIMVQLKSKLPFGSLNLYLKSYRPPPAPEMEDTGR